ncbi:hypothetical protein ETAA8_08640 [Anatilimnocola aggregata]|uniref:YcxB-like protein domain-containing protein n=1 Tax=Anatilimnocola aggregata TaxID=2528021 RepID=A0A517Y6D5_9BACT|nr:hypothetical protein [Anatilimnocola aggregata]QDU25793.1 hypothetical protein ETAA8_08640 [Anatilimnocola aggregata]
MTDLSNPYASPELPPERDELYERRTIVGHFSVDEFTQRDGARGYRIRHVIWLLASLWPLLVMIPLPLLLWRGDPTRLVVGMLLVFVVGSFVTIGIHVSLDWSIFWHNLRQLRKHRVVGALGPWQVTIDEQTIHIRTRQGTEEWPLKHVRRMELAKRPVVLWLEHDLAIAIPKHGDYGEDDYAAVCKTLRSRIPHIGGKLAKWR